MDLNNLTTTTLTLLRQHKPLIAASTAILLLSGAVPLLSRLISSYRVWYALGPNGLPLNPFGYLFQALASPFARIDTRVPAPYDISQVSQKYGVRTLQSFLPGSQPLSPRSGPRPDVPTFVGPQRQTSQQAASQIREGQEAFLHALAAANPAEIRVRPSNLEGPLFNSLWLAEGLAIRDEIKRLHGEFAHPHGEGSTHLVLSLKDAADAIEKGWAERHRISGVGGLMPWGFVLIYAPRDEREMEVWKRFVVASARYALGGKGEVVMP
ncbi:hypothetical protein GGR53DRAFT_197898 [Hypoxylon sp. FL1150]|nr:hypothetical protein GGR53DRAFT_197898 [Hypoxylon sp. FL1150]